MVAKKEGEPDLDSTLNAIIDTEGLKNTLGL